MPTARVNGINIWYEQSDGTGSALVLTHGFAGPTSGWPPVIDEFRSRFKLLLYDVRGHGLSSAPEDESAYSVPQFAADLAGLLDTLGIERPHVGGVSMGGVISAQFACDYPERLRSLLLCDTTAGNDPESSTASAAGERVLVDAFCRQERIVLAGGIEELVRRENRYRREGDLYAARSSQSLDEQDARNDRKLQMITPHAYLAISRALRERPDLTSRTPAINVPTLVSCGEWDAFSPCAERDHRLIANSRLATVRGAAHSTPDYQPQRWKRAVFDFIDDVEAGRDIRGEVEYA
jgi:pimeloyl-ACP methyl ester carboxylesterase